MNIDFCKMTINHALIYPEHFPSEHENYEKLRLLSAKLDIA